MACGARVMRRREGAGEQRAFGVYSAVARVWSTKEVVSDRHWSPRQSDCTVDRAAWMRINHAV